MKNLVLEELINLIYEFLKNLRNLVPEELINLIYEFPKNSTNDLVPEELRKISIFMNSRWIQYCYILEGL